MNMNSGYSGSRIHIINYSVVLPTIEEKGAWCSTYLEIIHPPKNQEFIAKGFYTEKRVTLELNVALNPTPSLCKFIFRYKAFALEVVSQRPWHTAAADLGPDQALLDS